jgi:PAS domain S-box-containing protein
LNKWLAARPFRRLALSAASLGGALLVRWILDPALGDTLALVTLFGAVAAAVWLSGYVVALVLAIIGYIACSYLFIEPRGQLGLDTATNITGFLAYLFTVAIIVGLGERVRQAECTARLRAEWFRTTLASIGDAVIATGRDGRIAMLNPVAQQLTGYEGDTAIGRPLQDVFRIVHESTRDSVENPVQKVLRYGQIVGLANHTVLIGRDGTERAIDDSAAPIRAMDGEMVGCVLVFRDVSDKRLRERALRDADRRKDEFLAMLAHELRNPLAAISNAVHLLQMKSFSLDGAQDVSSVLDRQVGQMVRLVDDLLDVSRITRGKVTLRREPAELGPLVHQALEASRAQIDGMGQTVDLVLPPKPMVLDCDAARMVQVIGNLLNNASKFSPSGARIEVSVDAEDDAAVLRVRDRGIGIGREHLPVVFDMFVQVDASVERAASGLGIGLTLVKSLVELHGGTVEARSGGPSLGSEFIVRLPLADGALRSAAPIPAGGITIAPRRVLIVDDNEDGATTLALLLEAAGHETFTAHDGPSALDLLDRHRPDVVLLDIGLPSVSGYEVCRQIRTRPWAKAVTLVAVTGWGQNSDRQKSREAGFDHHLLKPLEFAELQRVMQAAVRPPDAA